MKKITFLLLSLVSSIAFSQVTYLSTDFASQNESFLVSHSTTGLIGNDFVQTGVNFNWDYSNLVPSTQETLLWQNPNNAGYKTIWCLFNGYIFNCNAQFNSNFNLATKLTDGLVIQGSGLTNVMDHLKLSTTTLEDKMVGASITFNGTTVPFTASYQTPDIIYQFPITYNDTYANTSLLNLDLSTLGVPLQYTSNGQRINTVEGWGSLTTPFGTFANVLKMKTIFVNSVSVTINGTTTQNIINTVSYKWFDPAYGIPVLQVDGYELNVQYVPTNITYFDIPRCLTPNSLFAFFPLASDFNPVTNNASVSFINLSSNYDSLSWDFGDGTPTSTTINPTHNYSCPGTYDVTLDVINGFCDPDQTGTLTIPVTITDTQNDFTTGVTVNGTTLTADRTLAGTTYQWIDCDNNTPIDGANGQIYSPGVSGNYAVQLTTNGCQSISNCNQIDLLNTTSFDSDEGFVLYPNPTTGFITIDNNQLKTVKSIGIYTVLGEFVTNKLDLSSQANGMYFIKIITENTTLIKKIIKK